MAKFITRVQLEQAQPTDLEKLDLEMQKESFIRVREDHPGIRTRSTATEYNFQGNTSLLDVNGAVLRAANKTGKKYSFTVIKEKRIPFPLTVDSAATAPLKS
jgi:hypothetical protein